MSISLYVESDICFFPFSLTADPLAMGQRKTKGGVTKRRTYLRYAGQKGVFFVDLKSD